MQDVVESALDHHFNVIIWTTQYMIFSKKVTARPLTKMLSILSEQYKPSCLTKEIYEGVACTVYAVITE